MLILPSTSSPLVQPLNANITAATNAGATLLLEPPVRHYFPHHLRCRISAHVSMPVCTSVVLLLLDESTASSVAVASSGFKSSESFVTGPLQPVPRFSSDPGSGQARCSEPRTSSVPQVLQAVSCHESRPCHGATPAPSPNQRSPAVQCWVPRILLLLHEPCRGRIHMHMQRELLL